MSISGIKSAMTQKTPFSSNRGRHRIPNNTAKCGGETTGMWKPNKAGVVTTFFDQQTGKLIARLARLYVLDTRQAGGN